MTEYIKQIYSHLSTNNQAETGIKVLAKSELLQIGNHLTGLQADKKINLDVPQLVVVGTQSSGKSTLLNRIIDMDILPTGKMMVTRTPMNLQLINSALNCAEFGDYIDGVWKVSRRIEFAPDVNKAVAEIHSEIEVQTTKKAGTDQGISHTAIVLKIYASHVPNLSLIDLPGLTSVACVDRGQPVDIKDQIKRMVGSYIKSPRSIILLVMPARSDLEVDQAFELAKEYDPNSDRTIGVITKVDLMNTGTDICSYLKNEGISQSLQLRYGYFAIKNRGPDQKDQSLTSKQLLESEVNYFKTHPTYSQLFTLNRFGINNLIAYLSQVLTDHIKSTLPSILLEIDQLDASLNKSLQEIGQYIPEKEVDQAALIHMLVANFCKNFTGALNDRGATMNYGRLIKESFTEYRQTVVKTNYSFTDAMISGAIANCDGNHMLSVPTVEVLEYCLKKPQEATQTTPLHILHKPSIQCLEKVNGLLIKLGEELTKNVNLMRFPCLVSAIRKELTGNILNPYQQQCQTHISDLIKIEENYIWTEDSKFVEELQKLYQAIKPNKIDYGLIRHLINSYFDTVKRNLMDRVPKEIMYHYTSAVETVICDTLYNRIIKVNAIGKLLEESPAIAEKRKRLTEQSTQVKSIKTLISSFLHK